MVNKFNFVDDEVLIFFNELNSLDFSGLKQQYVPEKISCIYFLYDEIGTLLYVGKTTHLAERIISHKKEGTKKFAYYTYYEMESEKLTMAERFLINKMNPLLNKDTLTMKYKKLKENGSK